MSPTPTPEPAAASAGDDRPKFLRELDTLIRARYPLVYLVSWEEQRVDALLEGLANTHGKALYEWSVMRGLKRQGSGSARLAATGDEDSREPRNVLLAIEKIDEPSIVVLKDFHAHFQDPAVVRGLRELSHALKSTYTTVILLSPTLAIPPELEKEITVLDIPLPTVKELFQLVKDITGVLRKSGKTVSLTRDQAVQMAKAARGLTLAEAENAFAKAVADDELLDVNDIALFLQEKRQIIRKGGLLEFYSAEETLSDVGGLDLLKQWLQRRSAAFSYAAREFGLPEPKGLLLLGVQGCGKSLMAKAVSAQWRLPLLRLDMGRIFSGLVGSSEENLRRAIQMAEGVAPVVLWVDEVEKGLAGSTGGGTHDGGVTARVFGTFLTWLQEKQGPVFVVATANRIDGLPPELLRKGRFDEIFFVDLPGVRERRDVLGIHLRRRGRDPRSFDLDVLARKAESFSGAELEQAVISALYDAFAEGKPLEQRHLETAIGETFPIATTMREEIDGLREWAKHRTRPASSSGRGGGAT